MLVLSSPSGAGKTTIASHLLELDSNLVVSISVTTRPKRPREVDGKHYYFVSKEAFQLMAENGEFLEHAEVFGNYYGTPKKLVLDTLSSGKDIVFDIDWQGTQQLAQLARTDLISIFILPPSTKELEKRLRRRGQDSEKVLQGRMSESLNEISHWAEYEYVIINKDLHQSISQVQAILTAERLKRTRQLGLVDFINQLRHLG
jgi:guanylate kinase